MPADLQAIMDAAEQAAAASDFPSAARHLRDAATLQERALGPANSDLANTLNNLGVVSERLGEIEEAERCFRRAYAIATSALPADHPFVATSRSNLDDFCRLYGRSFEEPVESKEPDLPVQSHQSASAGSQDPAYTVAELFPSEDHDPAYQPIDPIREAPLHTDGAPRPRREPDREPAPRIALHREATPVEPPPRRGIPIGLIAVAAMAVLIVIGWMAWPSGTLSERSRAVIQETTPPAVVAPAPEPSNPAAATPPPVDPKPAPPATSVDTPPAATDSAEVVDARLCRNLSTSGAWQCDAVTGDVAPGPIYFFTRIVAERAITVQHRWYFDDQLRQNVMLSIQPNRTGYRTYSRTTIPPERTGGWRVEVRTEDGRVLREERFTVR